MWQLRFTCAVDLSFSLYIRHVRNHFLSSLTLKFSIHINMTWESINSTLNLISITLVCLRQFSIQRLTITWYFITSLDVHNILPSIRSIVSKRLASNKNVACWHLLLTFQLQTFLREKNFRREGFRLHETPKDLFAKRFDFVTFFVFILTPALRSFAEL